MRRLLVATVLMVAVLVSGVLLAAANLNTWLHENREWIASEVQRIVGRRVSFGELEVSIWSGFGVRVADVSIGDDPAYSKGDFISAGTVEVRVEILPALMGDIQVGRVVLREPSIRVIQTARGLSVDSLGSQGAARTSAAKTPDAAAARDDARKAAEEKTPKPASGASQALALTVSLIDVQGGRLVFIDQTTKPPTELTLAQVDFSATDVSLTEPIRFELRAAALGADRQNVTISGTLGPMSADGGNLELDVDLAAGPLSIENALALPAMKEALPPDMSASGTLRIQARLEGRLDALAINGELDATDASFAFGGGPGEVGEVAGGGLRKPLGETLRFEWSAVRQGDSLNVSKADLQLGDTQIHAEAKLEDLSSAVRVSLSVQSDRVGLADFGFTATEGNPEDEIRDLAIEARVAMPDSGLRLTVKGNSRVGVLSGAVYDDLKFELEFANGRATLNNLSLGAFDGLVRIGGYYDLDDDPPSFSLDARLETVSIAKLAESQSRSMGGMLEGTLAANLSVRGQGSEWEEIRDVMVGSGNLIMEDGTLKDVNLADSVMKGITGVAGLSNLIDPQVREKYPAVFGVGDTVFEKLDAKLDIRHGVARVRDFRLAARDYTLTGEGKFELRNVLDMRVAMILSEALTDDLVASVNEARYLKNSRDRIEIPVRLRGGIPDVRAEPDLSVIARALQAELLGGILKMVLGSRSSEGNGEGEQHEADGPELLLRSLEGLFGGGRK